MPYVVEWGLDRVTVKFTGAVTTFEFVDGARVIGADPRFDELRCIVNDFRAAQVDGLALDQALEGLVESAAGGVVSNPAIKVAVVSSHPEIVRLAQEFLAVMGDERPAVAVFDDEAQALDWMRSDDGARRLRPRFESW